MKYVHTLFGTSIEPTKNVSSLPGFHLALNTESQRPV